MKRIYFIPLLYAIISPTYAEDTKTQKAMDWIMQSCISSGSKVSISAQGQAGLKFKSLLNSGVQGEVTLDYSQLQGLGDELNKVSTENADKVRNCIEPYRMKIFNAIMEGSESENKTTSTENPYPNLPVEIIEKAKSGDAESQAELGRLLWVESKNYAESAIWDEKAASQGDTIAQWRMGYHYKDGIGVKTDYKKAVFWYEKAAEKNNPSSLHSLAEIYANGGYGIKKDLSIALQWAERYSKLIPKPDDADPLLKSIHSQTPLPDIPNASFERDETYWGFLRHSNEYTKGIDKKIFHSGTKSAYIASKSNSPSKFTTITNFHPNIERLKGNRIRVSAYIKTENVEKEAGIWARVDLDNNAYILDNMMDRPFFGTNDWKKATIVLDVPTNASAIVFGAIFDGIGKAWFDDFKFEIVDSSTPVTSLPLTKK